MKTSSPDTRPSSARSAIVKALPHAACGDEGAAVEFLEKLRWEDHPACAHCGSLAVYQIRTRDGSAREKHFRWRCRDCQQIYSVRNGTVFEDSRVPLYKWVHAFWSIAASKKGKSALQLKRELQVTYKTALFIAHRIRWAMANLTGGPFGGTVEIDETYVGGKPRYKGIAPRGRGTRKAMVLGMVERGGRLRLVHAKGQGAPMRGPIARTVSRDARIVTDDLGVYRGIGKQFAQHDSILHKKEEYVRRNEDGFVVHTNTIEGAFSLLKRGVNGTFHSISKKHLHRYLAEFQYRYNTRDIDDGERFKRMVKSAVGKRLTYQQQLAGKKP
jgi:transposase-like protein